MKMVMACLGRLNGAHGRLVARWLGQRCWFHKWDMPMACQVTREGERGRLAFRFFRGGQRMWKVHNMVSIELDKEGKHQYFSRFGPRCASVFSYLLLQMGTSKFVTVAVQVDHGLVGCWSD
jgi:hypothetical protein